MRYVKLYNSYENTGLVRYRGLLESSLYELNNGNIEETYYHFRTLSNNLERFICETGLYYPIKSLYLMDQRVKETVRTLSNVDYLSHSLKTEIEDFIYNLMTCFGTIHKLCADMYVLGL